MGQFRFFFYPVDTANSDFSLSSNHSSIDIGSRSSTSEVWKCSMVNCTIRKLSKRLLRTINHGASLD